MADDLPLPLIPVKRLSLLHSKVKVSLKHLKFSISICVTIVHWDCYILKKRGYHEPSEIC